MGSSPKRGDTAEEEREGAAGCPCLLPPEEAALGSQGFAKVGLLPFQGFLWTTGLEKQWWVPSSHPKLFFYSGQFAQFPRALGISLKDSSWAF